MFWVFQNKLIDILISYKYKNSLNIVKFIKLNNNNNNNNNNNIIIKFFFYIINLLIYLLKYCLKIKKK